VTSTDRSARPVLRPLVALPALLWEAVARARNALYDAGRLRPRRLACAVVSVGNLTVGGTGKTPVVSHLAAALRDAGLRVGVVSRGYRGTAERRAALVADGRAILLDARAAGDEPLLIARDNPGVPVAVGADRAAAARLLLEAVPLEVLLLDDGFQHRRLARNLDLLLVDAGDPWGNGRILPRGPLREPLEAVARADAIVLTRSNGSVPEAVRAVLERHHPRVPVLHCGLRPRGFVRPDGGTIATASLRGFAAFAFSGIARPERFERDLLALGLRLAGTRRFPDHHRFAPDDPGALAEAARACGAEVLVTTEKDLVRLPGPPPASPPLYALALTVEWAGGEPLPAFVLGRLGTPRIAGIGGRA
jgi:tetraacyldisaccharide 4'-kinase